MRGSYKAKHWPMTAALDRDDLAKYHRLRSIEAAKTQVLRGALAYRIKCQNPLLATWDGYQYCPYVPVGFAHHPCANQMLRDPSVSRSTLRSAKPSIFSLSSGSSLCPLEPDEDRLQANRCPHCKISAPIIEYVEAGPTIARLVRPMHRDDLELRKETASDHL